MSAIDVIRELIRTSSLPPVLTFEKLAAMQHEGSWADVAAKAKRLVMDGQVTVLRNAPTHVMGHVIGDHGEYDCEISRHDPQSSIIEQWNCECPWAQYAFDRTRKWKHLEGRVCSHVLGLYWRAKGTPIDFEELEPGQQAQPGQRGPQPQAPLPGVTPPPREVARPGVQLGPPTGPPTQPPPTTGPAGAPAQPPATMPLVTGPAPTTPVVPPPQTQPQYQQMQLFDITRPIGQQPVPAATPVSIPGGAPPTPGNPVQFPGTFSHFIPVMRVHSSDFIYADAQEIEQYLAEGGRYVALSTSVALELSGGKIPVPGAQPYDVSNEGVPLYRVVDLGWNPETQSRENADVNLLQGAPEQRGTYATFRPGTRAEVLDWDPATKMAYINVPLNYQGQDVRLHPHSGKGWVELDEIRPATGRNPFRA